MAVHAPDPAVLAAEPRDALRRATAHLHAQVDACMPLSRPSPGLADYHLHLCLLRDWVRALRVLPVPAARLDAEAVALKRDIDDCERLLPQAACLRGTAVFAPSPNGHDPDALGWGVAYVIEGSRLGGQVLYRRLAETLAPHPLRYLQGAGPRTGAQWRLFLESLRQALQTPARVDAACQGAVLAFECLLLQRRLVEPLP